MKKYLLKIRATFFRWLHKPRMLNNIYTNPDGTLSMNTRISSTTDLVLKNNIFLANDVYVGHYTTLDGSAGLEISEGCQIASGVAILTHSSHLSIRLFGKSYSLCQGQIEDAYIKGKVTIGKYTFIGSNVVISPNIKIGKGCIIGANSFLNINLPDYSIAYGSPAKIVGDTREVDTPYLNENPKFKNNYKEWANE